MVDTGAFARVRQRKLGQWTLAYLAGAWCCVQVFDLLGEQFDWPIQVLRTITSLFAYGVLPVLVIAWYHGERGAQRIRVTEAGLLGGLAIGAAGLVWWMSAVPSAELTAHSAGKADTSRIAVLPFEDFSPEGRVGYLGEGIAESLLRAFTEVEGLSVIARTSSFAYRGRDVVTIARELNVGAILEGSVQRANDRLRIIARLVRTDDQTPIWALSFDRDAEDIFAVQDEIAASVISALLGSGQRPAAERRAPTTQPHIYDLYLQARNLVQTERRQDLQSAMTLLEQVIALDPDYAPAHSELARVLGIIGAVLASQVELRARLEGHVERALELNPYDALAHAVRGLARLFGDGNARAAREDLEQAIALSPSDAGYLVWLAHVEVYVGHLQAAGRLRRRAFDLDPRNPSTRWALVTQFVTERRCDAALPLAQETFDLFPEGAGRIRMSETHLACGDVASAVSTLAADLERSDERAYRSFLVAQALNLMGEFELAERWLAAARAEDSAVHLRRYWYWARGNLLPTVAIARSELEREGDEPRGRFRLAEALLANGRIEEGGELLEELLANTDDASMQESSFAQLYAAVHLLQLARVRGEHERAGRLSEIARAQIERIVVGAPEREAGLQLELAIAQGETEPSGAWLEAALGPDPRDLHAVLHLPWYEPIRESEAGRAFLDGWLQDLQRQRERLRGEAPPWLFEPERLPRISGAPDEATRLPGHSTTDPAARSQGGAAGSPAPG